MALNTPFLKIDWDVILDEERGMNDIDMMVRQSKVLFLSMRKKFRS
jgi:hypothetical protein